MPQNPPPRSMTNVPYNPEWPVIFESIKTIIQNTYSQAIAIEHVGSTAIPGMSAKPRLDIDVVITHEAELPTITSALETLGYFSQGNLGRAGREAFGRTNDHVPYDGAETVWMKHNLYVCPQDSPVLADHLLFRDYLRTHPELAKQYCTLKENLATRFPEDQDAYVAGKSEFVASVLTLARGK